MTEERTGKSVAPTSRGAQILDAERLVTFLSDAYWATEQCGTLGGLLLIRLLRGENPLPEEQRKHACYLISQLARQADAVGMVDDQTAAVVLKTLQGRGDLPLMMERVQDFFNGSAHEWDLTMGVSVFPLCGAHPDDAWSSARRDLDGAMSHESWEHEIPRDTLRTNEALGGLGW